MSDKVSKSTRVLDAIFHDLAMDVAESRALTEEELADYGIHLDEAVKKLTAEARKAIASARRERLTQARHDRLASEHRSSFNRFLGLSKDAIVDRLRQLQLEHPGQLQVEHRDLDSRSEDDLRSLLADLEDLLSDGS